jgi:hypothetical protein
MDKRRSAVLICFLFLTVLSSDVTAQRHLKPQPNLPIDCADYNQPCTGTVCVSQQTEIYCAEDQTTHICENDTQNYVGGDQICCTGKNWCFDCPYNGRVIHYYGYYAATSHTCVPNH